MTSQEITALLVAWLRFGRQMPYVATEAGQIYLADVLAMNDSEMVEVEVKTSYSDLSSDFNSKEFKHRRYLQEAPSTRATTMAGIFEENKSWVPNKVYFAVPQDLTDDATKLLTDKAPLYGIITVLPPTGRFGYQHPWKRVSVIKSAKKLHDKRPSHLIKLEMAKRMSSDLSHFHLMRHRYGDLLEEMKSLSRSMADAEAQQLSPKP